MGRLTVRLPGTLHDQLADLAEREGVSLNQYIVYALTRQTTLAYTAQTLPEQAVAEQRASYTALLQNLGRASFEQIKMRELGELRKMVQRVQTEPAPDNLAQQLYGTLGCGSWDEYDQHLDWQRFGT